MSLTDLWDVNIIVSIALSVTVALIMLGILAVTNRRLRCLTSEMDSIRREMKLVDEGVKNISTLLGEHAASERKSP